MRVKYSPTTFQTRKRETDVNPQNIFHIKSQDTIKQIQKIDILCRGLDTCNNFSDQEYQ